MIKTARYFLFAVSVFQLFFAIAFFFQWPYALSLWPFPGTTPLTFIFISSIFAAAAASTLWAVLSKNYGAFAGIALDYITILTPMAILTLQLGANTENSLMTTSGILCIAGAVFGFGLLLWSVRFPINDGRPMPQLVRASFIIFIIALLFVSLRLIFKIPNTIPWMITPELSVVIGWMFLGAAVYFVYGLLRLSWINSVGQLVGFLAYDAVLIVPFLNRLPVAAPEHRIGLFIYITVVLYSGLLAIYYLFFYRPKPIKAKGFQPG